MQQMFSSLNSTSKVKIKDMWVGWGVGVGSSFSKSAWGNGTYPQNKNINKFILTWRKSSKQLKVLYNFGSIPNTDKYPVSLADAQDAIFQILSLPLSLYFTLFSTSSPKQQALVGPPLPPSPLHFSLPSFHPLPVCWPPWHLCSHVPTELERLSACTFQPPPPPHYPPSIHFPVFWPPGHLSADSSPPP